MRGAFGSLCAASLLAICIACAPATPPVVVHDAAMAPQRLSEWGVVFADGDYLRINDGVTPYDLNTPLFSDYAQKLRTVWLPPGTQAEYRDQGPFEFPVGTIISKTFHYRYESSDKNAGASIVLVVGDGEVMLDERDRLALDEYHLVETRLLVRYAEGWKAFPYIWNAAQTDATLEVAGDIRPYRYVRDGGVASEFNYVVPDANQCSGCHAVDHSSKAIEPIGPRAWQLDRDYRYQGIVRKQLTHWLDTGIIDRVPANLPRGANWLHPGDASLEDRTKAYLDVNCAHCHNAVGAADTSGLDLDLGNPVGRSYGICKPPVAVGRGSGDRPFDIYPGRPDESILLYRMQHSDPAIAMPELGRSLVHDEGVHTVREWIASLDGDC